MTISHTPGLLIKEAGLSVGTQLTRVYLVQDGVDPDTGDPLLVFDSAGPATHFFTYDSGAGEILIDDGIAPSFPVVNVVLNAAGETVFYT